MQYSYNINQTIDSSDSLVPFRLPTLHSRGCKSQVRQSPIVYQSPLKNLQIKPSNTSPRIREFSVSPQKYDELQSLEKDVSKLQGYSVLLSQIPQIQIQNIRNLITYNRSDRRQEYESMKLNESSKVSQLVMNKQSRIAQKLNDVDPFLRKTVRMREANRIAEVDRITQDQEQSRERQREYYTKLQEKRYKPYWEYKKKPMRPQPQQFDLVQMKPASGRRQYQLQRLYKEEKLTLKSIF